MADVPSPILRWRSLVISADGPASPTTRHVLLTLSVFMDANGECFPSTATLASATGLSERSVCTHLETAESLEWIRKRKTAGTGQGWKLTRYMATTPDALKEVQHEGTEGGSARQAEGTERLSEGTERRSRKALKEVQSNSPCNSPRNSYSSDFETAWSAYPKRPNNSKAAAWAAWQKHVKAGADPDAMTEGVRKYAAYLAAEGTEPRHVKMASTFFGPFRHWENDYTIAHRNGGRELLSGEATVQKTRAQVEHEQRRAKQLAELEAAEQEDPII